jgi:hypothetical protein
MLTRTALAALVAAFAAVSSTHAQEASLPIAALKAYCAAAGDTGPAVFSPDGRHGPATEWRCLYGSVLVCPAGADGVSCSVRSRSRVATQGMIDACRDAGYLPVSSGVMGSIWRWECRGGKPVIASMLTSLQFDDSGYAKSEWKPLR